MKRYIPFVLIILLMGCGSESSQTPPQNSDKANIDSNGLAPVTNSSDPSDLNSETPALTGVSINIPMTADEWSTVYDSNGSVNFNQNGVTMAPQAALGANTYAALLLSTRTQRCPLTDFTLTIHATTKHQLKEIDYRRPWEVFWVFFNYLPAPNSTKTTNYFINKPNGVELGRAYGDTDQKFLPPFGPPFLILNQEDEFVLDYRSGTLKIFVDGFEAVNYSNQTFPESLYTNPGAIGLYTEDAQVNIRSVQLQPLGSFDSSCYQ